MRKLVILIALVAFIGVYTAPAFASSESARIVMAKYDDEPKKKKETKKNENQNKENKVTTEPKECPQQKECKQECKQTCHPSTSDENKKTEEKK
jgi:hypothetical protein